MRYFDLTQASQQTFHLSNSSKRDRPHARRAVVNLARPTTQIKITPGHALPSRAKPVYKIRPHQGDFSTPADRAGDGANSASAVPTHSRARYHLRGRIQAAHSSPVETALSRRGMQNDRATRRNHSATLAPRTLSYRTLTCRSRSSAMRREPTNDNATPPGLAGAAQRRSPSLAHRARRSRALGWGPGARSEASTAGRDSTYTTGAARYAEGRFSARM